MADPTEKADALVVPSHRGDGTARYPVMYVHVVWMWRIVALLVVCLIVLVWTNYRQTQKYVPAVQLVDMASGRAVAVCSATGGVAVGDNKYNLVQVQSVAGGFLRDRYQYQEFGLNDRLAEAFARMSDSAKTVETERVRTADLATVVVGAGAKYELILLDESWRVESFGSRFLRVSVRGTVHMTNATVYRERPFEKPVSFTLVLEQVVPSKIYPLGLRIVSNDSKDVL